jgi:hypothetical protein
MTPELDRALDALSERRRRRVLASVRDGPVETDALAEQFDDPEHAETLLCHADLPKLADAGYVDWRPEGDRVSPGPRFDRVEPLLDLLATDADDLPGEWP